MFSGTSHRDSVSGSNLVVEGVVNGDIKLNITKK